MATITGTDGADTIDETQNSDGGTLATIVADSIAGLGGADLLGGGLGNDTLAGGDAADTLDGDDGDDSLDGADLGDLLRGGAGADRLVGGAGANTLAGGAGSDTLLGGTSSDLIVLDDADLVGADSIDGGGGVDTLDFRGWTTLPLLELDLAAGTLRGGLTGGALVLLGRIVAGSVENALGSGFGDLLAGDGDANRLEGLGGADTLRGGSSNDTLLGGEADDRLEGGSGNDSLVGGAGNDLLAGGDGVDWAGFADAAAGVFVALSAAGSATAAGDTLTGIENLAGGEGADTLQSLTTGGSHLRGLGGADSLYGFMGDTLEGGSGDDTYLLVEPGVTITEASSGGADTVVAGFTYELTPQVEALLLTGSGDLTGLGNSIGNVIVGNAGDNLLAGFDGADTLDGGAGADVMVGGRGADTFIVDNAADQVVDEAGETARILAGASFTAYGAWQAEITLLGEGDLAAAGSVLNDRLTGNGGDNLLSGGEGDDWLDGGAGADSMVGGAGRDTYVLDDPGDTILDTAGTENFVRASVSFTLPGSANWAATILLVGSDADLDATGGTGNDQITGSGSDNLLSGLSGADTLNGAGGGRDTMDGGDGDDRLFLMVGEVLALGGAGNDTLDATELSFDGRTLDGGQGDDRLLSAFTAALLLGGDGRDSLQAVSDASTLDGGAGADTLVNGVLLLGGNGTDSLRGSGAAILDGGAGADTLSGRDEGDRFIVDNAADVILDAGGRDTVVASLSWTLGAALEDLVLAGSATLSGTGNTGANLIQGNGVANTLSGLDGADTLQGGTGADLLRGGTGEDSLAGEGGADTLQGGAGNDHLDGGNGADRLSGGLDADSFVLAVLPPAGQHDRLADFAAAQGDRIEIVRAMLGAAGAGLALGPLDAASFAANLTGAASAAAPQLTYDTNGGELRWNPDGTGPEAAVLLAVLEGAPGLTAGDIWIV
jgi:Ca2+-binding RTX toxin-like protein